MEMQQNKSETTYGRKIIKGNRKKKSEYSKILYISWGLCILIGLIVGVILSWGISHLFKDEHIEAHTPIVEDVSKTMTAPEPKIISLGEYKLTAYCSCEKCCGYWATIRPLDEDGNPIVYTADQSIAKQGVTVAADTSVLPFGTVLLIDGHEYIVQDRGGAIKGNRIDVYFESHEEALQFGVQYKEIFMKGENNNALY
jgi:3D (Asp-Asp-Asp) domain-containing protein